MNHNYFRITAYYPAEDISCIMDTYGNIPPVKETSNQFILRACMKGKVEKNDGIININGRYYKTYR